MQYRKHGLIHIETQIHHKLTTGTTRGNTPVTSRKSSPKEAPTRAKSGLTKRKINAVHIT